MKNTRKNVIFLLTKLMEEEDRQIDICKSAGWEQGENVHVCMWDAFKTARDALVSEDSFNYTLEHVLVSEVKGA